MRPAGPFLDVNAIRGQISPSSTSTSTPNSEPAAHPRPLAVAMMATDEIRDSRSSSSSNSPAPPDNEESDFYLGANDSQTSLGVVPNMQDMQVNDDDCTSTIAALPSEILISIFSRLADAGDLFRSMLVCKRWSRNVVEILWHRPACSTWKKHESICRTLGHEKPHFAYPDFVKRLNLAQLAQEVNDGSVQPLAVCHRVERLTLTNCKNLTDSGLIPLVTNNHHLLALDISGDEHITENTIVAIAENCRRLQGLNMTGCRNVSNESLKMLAENCRYIKRLKLNDCGQVNDDAVLSFAYNCPNILEIDLHNCKNVGNEPITALMARGQSLRELRLAMCERIDDSAFLSLPPMKKYEHLRILDLTSCARLTDRAVENIIDAAPRLRNLVLAKCGNITDAAVFAIAKLSKNLHYVHLGHCRHITDDGVKKLVASCNRIRYIDLGCCTHLTDESVTRLATLPKLKRIGLVKCTNITDQSMYALARANHRSRQRRDQHGNIVPQHDYHTSSLERVHLSYCVNLTLPSIIKLLNCCPKLTHLSLTGVTAFLREDLEKFCRDAPADFNEHQRSVFCVFSGHGVSGLRQYLNSKEEFHDFQDHRQRRRDAVGPGVGMPPGPMPDIDGFDDADVIDDDDMGEGSEIALDVGPGNGNVMGQNNTGVPPPPPPPPTPPFLTQMPPGGQPQYAQPTQAPTAFPGTPQAAPFVTSNNTPTPPLPAMSLDTPIAGAIPVRSAPVIPQDGFEQIGAGPSTAGVSMFSSGPPTGPSTASMQGQQHPNSSSS